MKSLKERLKKNSKGQATLEYVLLMFFVITVWTGISKSLQSNGFFNTVFGEPWQRLSSTIEFGIPASTGAELTAAKGHHPSQLQRHATPKSGGGDNG